MALRLRRARQVRPVSETPRVGPDMPIDLGAPFRPADNDPILPFLLSAPGAVDVDRLSLRSPALDVLRARGVTLLVPLKAHGDLVGMIALGPRRSDQPYSTDDKRLLENLAAQAAPSLRVAQLVREQEDEARRRERYEQELRVARLIQEHLLPKAPPEPDGWELAAVYQPARHVGGDFYDFLDLPDGRLGLIVGDVTDKGVPAAMVMASTRSVLRAAAPRLVDPGLVLSRVNDMLCPDMPPNMFVTCFYAVIDTSTGRVEFANAGHNLPFVRRRDGVCELRARGMPLGLMPDMEYEQFETVIEPGDVVLFHSDGLAEAHNPVREMYGLPRLAREVERHGHGCELIARLMDSLAAFAGPDWEQEDDVTLVALVRHGTRVPAPDPDVGLVTVIGGGSGFRQLAQFDLPSVEGNEREAMRLVVEAVQDLSLPSPQVDRLQTAVAEAVMNAMEHGNGYDPGLAVHVRTEADERCVRVIVIDHGGGERIPDGPDPDLDAKLRGEQSPRGWGLFLIRNMVDELVVTSDETHHTLELVFRLHGGADDRL